MQLKISYFVIYNRKENYAESFNIYRSKSKGRRRVVASFPELEEKEE
jgi:hypothetical protein